MGELGITTTYTENYSFVLPIQTWDSGILQPISYTGIKQSRQFPLSFDEAIELEKKIFENKKAAYLMEGFENKYIALFSGIVIDSDSDFSELAKRIYNTFSYEMPIYITQVTKGERAYRMASPRLVQ